MNEKKGIAHLAKCLETPPPPLKTLYIAARSDVWVFLTSWTLCWHFYCSLSLVSLFLSALYLPLVLRRLFLLFFFLLPTLFVCFVCECDFFCALWLLWIICCTRFHQLQPVTAQIGFLIKRNSNWSPYAPRRTIFLPLRPLACHFVCPAAETLKIALAMTRVSRISLSFSPVHFVCQQPNHIGGNNNNNSDGA